jgi:hypothetical protein
MKTQPKMTAKQTEVLTLKLTALSVIADRLFDNKDIELFKKESLAIMATKPARDIIRGIAKTLYTDHKRVQAFELSTVYCNWLDSNGTRAKNFASYLDSTSTVEKVRLLSIEELAVKKAAFIKADKAARALIEKEKQAKIDALKVEVLGTCTQDDTSAPATSAPATSAPTASAPATSAPSADSIAMSPSQDRVKKAFDVLLTKLCDKDFELLQAMIADHLKTVNG